MERAERRVALIESGRDESVWLPVTLGPGLLCVRDAGIIVYYPVSSRTPSLASVFQDYLNTAMCPSRLQAKTRTFHKDQDVSFKNQSQQNATETLRLCVLHG